MDSKARLSIDGASNCCYPMDNKARYLLMGCVIQFIILPCCYPMDNKARLSIDGVCNSVYYITLLLSYG